MTQVDFEMSEPPPHAAKGVAELAPVEGVVEVSAGALGVSADAAEGGQADARAQAGAGAHELSLDEGGAGASAAPSVTPAAASLEGQLLDAAGSSTSAGLSAQQSSMLEASVAADRSTARASPPVQTGGDAGLSEPGAGGSAPSSGSRSAAVPPLEDSGPSAPVASQARSSHPQFLDKLKHPSAQLVVNQVRDFVNEFPANLTRPQAARRIHEFLSGSTPRLAATEAFASDPPNEAQQAAGEGLEKFVVLKLYKLLFRHSAADLREDERLDRCIKQSSVASSFLRLSAEARDRLATAKLELQRVDTYRAPRDKVVCLLNAHSIAKAAIEEYEPAMEDEEARLRKLLAQLIVEAEPPNFFSNVEFASAFRHPLRLAVEERTCLRNFSRALASVTGRPEAGDGAGGGSRGSAAEGCEAQVEDLPMWLVDAGVTFHFQDRQPGDLLIGEVDELLDEYHRMLSALRELSDPGRDCAEAR